MRRAVGVLCAFVLRLVTAGRIRGRRFILRPPATIRLLRGGRIVIGDDVMISPRARLVADGAELRIGARSFIGHNATLVAMAPLVIGSDALIGENCSIHTENHGPPGARGDFASAPIEIGDESWLGAGVVVLAGSTVGARATVGANAVVTGTLDADTTYVGIPARAVRRRDG